MSLETRPCGRCKTIYPRTAEYFYKESRREDGLRTVCKTCVQKLFKVYYHTEKTKTYKKEYRLSHATNFAGYNRAYRKRHPGMSARIARNWRRKNPEKARAHNVFWKAITVGEIRKSSCKICGAEKVHAHHFDYSKPLDVVWLCHKHHEVVHHDEEIAKAIRERK